MTTLDLAALHERLLSLKRDEFATTDALHDLFDYVVLYRHNLDKPQHLLDLAGMCLRRIAGGVPLDLVPLYENLSALARWKAQANG